MQYRLNCAQMVVKAICKKYDVDYEYMLLCGWDFNFQKELNSIGNQILSYKSNWHLQLLKQYSGINFFSYSSDCNKAFNVVLQELEKEHYVILNMNTKYHIKTILT